MFSICEAMKWNHLPIQGGLYDQHPDLLAGFEYMFSVRSRKDAERQAEEDRKNKVPPKRRRR